MNVFTEPKLVHPRHKPIVLPLIYLVSLVLLGLIVAAFLIAVRRPYDGLYWERPSGEVVEVDEDSPAAAAGLQPGDILQTVAGQPVSALQYGEPLVGKDSTVQIEARRQGAIHTFSLSAESASAMMLLKRAIPLFVAAFFAIFSFGIWVYQPYDWRVVLFWAFNQLGAAGLTFGTISNLGFLWAARWFGITLCLFSPVLVHFHTQITGADLKDFRRRALQGLYAFSLTLVAIWTYGTLQNDSQEYSVLRLVTQLFFIAAVILTIFLLTRAYFFASLQSWRWQVRLIALGILLAFTPLITLALLPSLLWGKVLVAYELTFPFLLFMPLSHTVAIYHSNLLQIERLVNRRIIHIALLVITSVIYLIVFTRISTLWSVPQNLEPLLWGSITLLSGILFIIFHNRLRGIIDRIVYGGWYNYRSVVAAMSQELGSVVDSEDLADLLVNRLADVLHLECAALLLCNDEMQLVIIRTVGCNVAPPTLNTNSTLVATLLDKLAVSTTELRALLKNSSLTDKETIWLEHPQIQIWVPIKHSEKVQALLLLGKRLDGEIFDEEDRQMLNTLAWGAAVAVENVKLIRELKQRTDEVNLLYSQLLQGREEERKRLARELHDSVIQNLINLHHYLDPSSRHLAPTRKENALALRSRLENVIDQLRDLCTQLRPAALDDLSLDLAIQGYIEDAKDQYGLDIIFNESDARLVRNQYLSEAVKLCLFRVTQEAITNVHRHAGTATIWIDLSLKQGNVVLEIRDNGKGFSCPANLGTFTRTRHFGLVGLQERLHLIGGTLTIRSAPGKGTCLRSEVAVDSILDVD